MVTEQPEVAAGILVSELLNLHLSDLNSASGHLMVRGTKSALARVVYRLCMEDHHLCGETRVKPYLFMKSMTTSNIRMISSFMVLRLLRSL